MRRLRSTCNKNVPTNAAEYLSLKENTLFYLRVADWGLGHAFHSPLQLQPPGEGARGRRFQSNSMLIGEGGGKSLKLGVLSPHNFDLLFMNNAALNP